MTMFQKVVAVDLRCRHVPTIVRLEELAAVGTNRVKRSHTMVPRTFTRAPHAASVQLHHTSEKEVLNGQRQTARAMRCRIIPLLVALVLAACKTGVDIPDIVHEPELAGEIVQRVDLAEGPIELTLSGGERIELDRMTAANLRPGTDPNEGDLLLYGTEPDGPWFWSGPLLDDPVTGRQCAGIPGPALDDGEAIVFEIGMRLPKAADFDPAEQRDGVFSNPTREFCIDEFGEVTRFGL
jgi:hypothetical protein